MPAWLFGLAITLLVGAAATAYLWLIRRRDDETAAGLLALAGMRWRDFSRLVLEAMELRGLQRLPSAHEENQEHSSSFMLNGQGRNVLLACKHGSAYRIGTAAVDEFASEVRLRGAQSGILVTEGVLDKGGVEKAQKYHIEIIDGPLLWPAVKPMVEGKLQRRIVGNASSRASRHIGIAWLGAITLGVASALVFPNVINRSAPTPANDVALSAAPASSTVPQVAPVLKPATPTLPSPTSAAPAPDAPPTAAASEAEAEKQRARISAALAKTPGISRGVWISRSTLSVDRIVDEAAAWTLVCNQLKVYPELLLTRVQMNPPQGSTDAVRWRQCEAL